MKLVVVIYSHFEDHNLLECYITNFCAIVFEISELHSGTHFAENSTCRTSKRRGVALLLSNIIFFHFFRDDPMPVMFGSTRKNTSAMGSQES